MYWMFTLNNPVNNEIPAGFPDVEYAVWQREKGAQGTEHLQGYVVFSGKKRRQWVNSHCVKAHWEGRKGNHSQAKEYCTKADTRIAGPWECGHEPAPAEPGKRSDLLSLKRALDAGATEGQIASDPTTFPVWAKYWKAIPRYRMLTGKQRDWPVFTQVIWGPPGVGKSRKARDLAGPEAFWVNKPAGQTVWWDGYIGQEVIVIDEFYGWIAFDQMCRLLDRYPMSVETKGSATPMLAKKVIITSNVPPLEWYKNMAPLRLNALWRRLEMPLGTIEHMLVPYAPVVNVPPAVADAPAPQLLADEQVDWDQFEQDAANAVQQVHDQREQPLTVAQMAGDEVIEVIPRDQWNDLGW
ncbi:Rep [uncultured virus]|uniref:ATP-dependent helicase Rep n=1 Tax=uncultured virus TaxID=340016 RepID=A0A2K9LS01_9VIRU|nr:Rep [uncultured virus]